MAKQNKTQSVNIIKTKEAITEPITTKISVWIFPFIIALFTIIINSNTFKHRFVLDDHGIIKNNKITKAPVTWENTKTIFSTPLRKGDYSDLENSLYRPFTKLLFNVEWNLFNGDPHKFHIVNVCLYAITCVLIFIVLYNVFQKKWILPFFITMLFMLHPVHTEVVANVKSADEILSLLGIIITLRCLQLYLTKENVLYLILGVLAYLMGSFSKESTIVAVAIIPLFIYFFTKASIQKNAIVSTVFLVCSLFFIFCRNTTLNKYDTNHSADKVSALDNYIVLCKKEEQKFLPLDLQEKYKNSNQFSSAVNTLGYYVRTFFVPYPLSCDYSFSTFEPVGFSDYGFLISFILFLAMFGFAIFKWKEKSAIGFGILWFFITISLVSNVFMLIGTSFGDRLLFIPSLGLCMALVLALYQFLVKKEDQENNINSLPVLLKKAPVFVGLLVIVLALYSFKTYNRNKDWKTDYNLFATDVEKFPNSTHLLFYMGNHLSSTERKEVLTSQLEPEGFSVQQINDSSLKESARSIEYLSKALNIFPALPGDGYNQLGKAYHNLNLIDSAEKYYKKAFAEDSTNSIYTNNCGTVYYITGQNLIKKGREYLAVGKTDSAQTFFKEGLQRMLYSNNYFLKAHKLDNKEADFCNNIGCVYGDTQRPDSAIYWFRKANDAEPDDLTSLQYLDITFRNMGKIDSANFYKTKLEQVKQMRFERLNQ